MDGVTALILAGGRVDELGALTARRAKAAVPFGGTYRIIDFPFTSLARSGLERVGVLSQYRPSSLMDHVGMGEAWGLIGRNREVRMLPPYQAETRVDWYNGSADAVAQNRDFWKDSREVLIVSGDHVYAMDYRPLLAQHRARGAALTMAFKRFPREEMRQYGVARLDGEGWVREYCEKPSEPFSDLGSLTIFVFDTYVLLDILERGRPASGPHQFYFHVIPPLVEAGRVQGWIFDGYWAYARSVDQYYRASMDALDPASGLDLDAWQIHTNVEESGTGGRPPFLVGPRARIQACRISSGCRIDGKVTGSILSPDVVVEHGAVVTDSVLMNNVRVGAGSVLHRVIADKHTIFGGRCRIGQPRREGPPEVLAQSHTCGAAVFGRECVIPAGSEVGGNTQVAPGTVLTTPLCLPAGACLETPEEV
ncbi:MAG: glucose-1-phosphate adenylyltransferase [Deltaproteobacteria bacterium]|nr:glucose-1-phosphate adenylyltransferase [Deltaproteobacteria bacterium]